MRHVQTLAVGNERVHFFLFRVLQAHIYGDCFECERLRRKTAVGGKSGKQQSAVLSARKPDKDFVAVFYHIVVGDCASHRAQYFLHKMLPHAYYCDKIINKSSGFCKRIRQIALT